MCICHYWQLRQHTRTPNNTQSQSKKQIEKILTTYSFWFFIGPWAVATLIQLECVCVRVWVCPSTTQRPVCVCVYQLICVAFKGSQFHCYFLLFCGLAGNGHWTSTRYPVSSIRSWLESSLFFLFLFFWELGSRSIFVTQGHKCVMQLKKIGQSAIVTLIFAFLIKLKLQT